eukprot:352690-Chlamydomonas_euryale.AAC.1
MPPACIATAAASPALTKRRRRFAAEAPNTPFAETARLGVRVRSAAAVGRSAEAVAMPRASGSGV